jgi:hypothetical protein
MEFYIVAGTHKEGTDLDSSKIFSDFEAALAYGELLLASYDAYEIVQRSVEQNV